MMRFHEGPKVSHGAGASRAERAIGSAMNERPAFCDPGRGALPVPAPLGRSSDRRGWMDWWVLTGWGDGLFLSLGEQDGQEPAIE